MSEKKELTIDMIREAYANDEYENNLKYPRNSKLNEEHNENIKKQKEAYLSENKRLRIKLYEDIIKAIQNEYNYSEKLAKKIYSTLDDQGYFCETNQDLNVIVDFIDALEIVYPLLKENKENS